LSYGRKVRMHSFECHESLAVWANAATLALESRYSLNILEELSHHFSRHRHPSISNSPEIILGCGTGGNGHAIIVNR